MSASDPRAPHVNVLIVGAGLSGIGAACHLQTDAPGTTYEILEGRETSGGTWDLFRYPGIRSDSDMFTLGYCFKPWTGAKSIADGADILDYIRSTSTEHGVEERIRYSTKVVAADWSAADSRWTVSSEDVTDGAQTTRTCDFLYLCSGYYRYDEGYAPKWPGQDQFTGQVVHPQQWPTDIDLTGKKIVVVGSGATAVTLVPHLAERAEHVTMLQRSPSYLLPTPAADPIADLLRKVLPTRRAYRAIRWKNIKMATAMYGFCRKRPTWAKALLRRLAVKGLPEGFNVDKHFSPSYAPWDQRMCMSPNGDFFAAVRSGKADVATDQIEAFTPTGLRLGSGGEMPADIVVTATGLNLLPLGGIDLSLDGEPVSAGERVAYKGMMLDGVPNLFFALGYTNASWTLKVDLVSSWVARLVRSMKQQGKASIAPRLPDRHMDKAPFIEMSSGYFERARTSLPRQGDVAPWRLHDHYGKDAPLFLGEPTADPALELRGAAVPAGA